MPSRSMRRAPPRATRRALANFQKELEELRKAAARRTRMPRARRIQRFARLMSNAGVVLQARAALADAGARRARSARAGAEAARRSRHAGQRISRRDARSGGASARALRSARAAAAARRDRARYRRRRIRAQAAQRLAESADYLGQVIKGFQGTDTGPRPAEGHRRRRPQRACRRSNGSTTISAPPCAAP